MKQNKVQDDKNTRLLMSICPDTNRVFLCKEGQDNNVAEVFAHGYDSADTVALQIGQRFNSHAQMLAALEIAEATLQRLAPNGSRATQGTRDVIAAAIAEGRYPLI